MDLVLLSGGVDSAVALNRSVRLAMDLRAIAVWFGWGQPAAAAEYRAASAIVARLRERGAKIDLHDVVIPVPASPMRSGPGVGGPRVVPGRNLAFLSIAATWAADLGCRRLVFGAIEDDAALYADCRPGFVQAFNAVSPIPVWAPLLTVSKREVVEEARAADLFDLSWSCYQPTETEPCGECDSCRARASAS